MNSQFPSYDEDIGSAHHLFAIEREKIPSYGSERTAVGFRGASRPVIPYLQATRKTLNVK
jgi:hypothetical protein